MHTKQHEIIAEFEQVVESLKNSDSMGRLEIIIQCSAKICTKDFLNLLTVKFEDDTHELCCRLESRFGEIRRQMSDAIELMVIDRHHIDLFAKLTHFKNELQMIVDNERQAMIKVYQDEQLKGKGYFLSLLDSFFNDAYTYKHFYKNRKKERVCACLQGYWAIGVLRDSIAEFFFKLDAKQIYNLFDQHSEMLPSPEKMKKSPDELRGDYFLLHSTPLYIILACHDNQASMLKYLLTFEQPEKERSLHNAFVNQQHPLYWFFRAQAADGTSKNILQRLGQEFYVIEKQRRELETRVRPALSFLAQRREQERRECDPLLNLTSISNNDL